MPIAVRFASNWGIKAIAYEKVVPLLVEAIKEQQTTIENLESRLKLLEDK